MQVSVMKQLYIFLIIQLWLFTLPIVVFSQDSVSVKLGGRTSAILNPKEMRKLKELSCPCTVQSYSFYYKSAKTGGSAEGQGTFFNKKILSYIKKAKSGDVYRIEKIKTNCKGNEQSANSLVFFINATVEKDTIPETNQVKPSLYNNLRSGIVKSGEIAAQKQLYLNCDNCQLLSFTLYFSQRKVVSPKKIEYNTFTATTTDVFFPEEMLYMVQAAKPGCRYDFVNIKIKDSSGQVFYTPSLSFFVK